MTTKIDGTNGVLQSYDYQTPTTGFSYTFASGITTLIMVPAGTLATGTITMPATPADGMTITFSSSQVITALTVNGNSGQSIVGAPTSMSAGGASTFVYRLSNTTWYTQTSTAVVSAPVAPVVTIYTANTTWTKPATIKAVKVTILSGGGGGGGARNRTTLPMGSGGGGGAGGVGFFPAPSIPGPISITVGTAGAGGPGPGAVDGGVAAGSPGGTSSFGPLISATGGSGASSVGNNPGSAPGGASGSITPSPTNIGFSGTAGTTAGGGPGGVGGDSFQRWGLGGAGGSSSAGSVGTGFGAGGGGGSFPSPGGGTAPGGAGTAGYIIVEEFY